jgi:predicted DNA-binding protein
MPEEKERITVGKSLSLSYSIDAIIIRLAPEARQELDKLAKEHRQKALQKAIEISIQKGHDYDVRLEDVIEAIKSIEKG